MKIKYFFLIIGLFCSFTLISCNNTEKNVKEVAQQANSSTSTSTHPSNAKNINSPSAKALKDNSSIDSISVVKDKEVQVTESSTKKN